MNITILTVGSRGDVQPFIALGVGLLGNGHRVKLATHATFSDLAIEYGLEFHELEGDPQVIAQGAAMQNMKSTRNPFMFMNRLYDILDPLLEATQVQSWNACQDADLILVGTLTFWGIDISEKLDVPCCVALPVPIAPTKEFPPTMVPPAFSILGGNFNRYAYYAVYTVIWQLFRKSINVFRNKILNLPLNTELFIKTIRHRKIPILSGVSPAVIPKPKDWTEVDHMTGYWFLEKASEFEPPQSLQNFLADGPPPVYVGFGSMGGEESHQTIEIALEALKQTGQRGIFLTGWSGLDKADLPDNIYKVSSIPHDWLFPQMSCIVHHGGAGTTASAFRAGVPAVIIPFLADQPFWGDRAYKLGVSPAPLDRKKLTTSQLAEAISLAVNDSAMHQRVSHLGEKIRSENGVQYTVNLIEQMLKDEIPSARPQTQTAQRQQ